MTLIVVSQAKLTFHKTTVKFRFIFNFEKNIYDIATMVLLIIIQISQFQIFLID